MIMLVLSLHNGGNPFFVQKRPGKNDRIFRIIKFKTMNNTKNDAGELLPDVERLTGVGKWIRATSLDEIPQLINVLIGDMSLVGPRPLLPEYLSLYSEEQKKRHLVKPGITGWAQVNGRNAISWEEKLRLDVWYVNHISFLWDIKIIFKTAKKVFKREGIQAANEATTTRFKGNTQ
jgi:lipopolysaccharide/colanic/teichoic acid biosynthesis glycosyltransferase